MSIRKITWPAAMLPALDLIAFFSAISPPKGGRKIKPPFSAKEIAMHKGPRPNISRHSRTRVPHNGTAFVYPITERGRANAD
jgi:hypothetical protein